MDKLHVSSVNKTFEDARRHDVVAIEDVSFSVRTGEFFCIVGPSGCGKSTLLQMILGLEKPSSGSISIDNVPVRGPRRDCGMVFQEYALFPWKTVRNNIEFGPRIHGIPARERRAISQKYIELAGLSGFENHYPHEISGGMKQRVAIARALANEPDIFLMDEPFAAVDAQLREILQQELLQIWRETAKTMIFITHQIEEAIFLGDRVLVMSARPGKVKDIIPVELPRPRQSDVRFQPEFQELVHRVKNIVWEEITDRHLTM